MTFQSNYKSAPVKGIVVSASNCSGKSYVLSRLSDDDYFSDVRVFEMDSLKYYNERSRNKRLPDARKNFERWLEGVADDDLTRELCANIASSLPKLQLVKMTFVELMSGPGQFITVLPGSMRHDREGIRFVEILEERFKRRVVHTAIIPSPLRYLLNLIYRKRVLKYRGMKIALAERARLTSKKPDFDEVIEMPLWSPRDSSFVDVFKKYIIGQSEQGAMLAARSNRLQPVQSGHAVHAVQSGSMP